MAKTLSQWFCYLPKKTKEEVFVLFVPFVAKRLADSDE